MPAPTNPGELLKLDRQLLQATLRLNTMVHLDISHHFGARLAARRRGGLILIGSVGAKMLGKAIASKSASASPALVQ